MVHRPVDVAALLLVGVGAAIPFGFMSSPDSSSAISGPLPDAACNVESVEQANEKQLHAQLESLVGTTFFRLINVNMETKCYYFGVKEEDEEPECESKSVETAVPLCSLGASEETDPFGAAMPSPAAPTLDQTISTAEDAALESFHKFEEDFSNEELPTFWMDMSSNIATNASDYVNLQLNPERYTGYNGSHVWGAIYQENCLGRLGGHDSGMCYEERVLYRLLSGMHAATNTHIARFYHAPSKRKNRTEWEPDLAYFQRQFQNAPERLRNMHFTFVVLLRALHRASPFLWAYSYTSGDASEDQHTALLVRRLLDSHILESCKSVFEGFDESLLFREKSVQPWWSLKKQFKGIFHNISRVIDCVSCQKCRLHAKVTMLGLGAALKLLLLPPELFPTATTREEIVALFNTLAKFSSAILHVKELTSLQYQAYFEGNATLSNPPIPSGRAPSTAPPRQQYAAPTPAPTPEAGQTGAAKQAVPAAPVAPAASLTAMLDGALGMVAALAAQGAISAAEEAAAVSRALAHDAGLLLLAKHFGGRPSIATHVRAALSQPVLSARIESHDAAVPAAATAAAATAAAAALSGAAPGGGAEFAADVVVVGSGVAGMTAALRLLDSGARVALVDKEKKLGGNSAKASSGINGCCPQHSRSEKNAADSVAAFSADTAKSARRDAGFAHTGSMIDMLAARSEAALEWLKARTTIDLSKTAQLGGHSYARTHRPKNGMIGAELVFALQKEIKKFEGSGQLRLLTGCRMTALLQEADGTVRGIAYTDAAGGEHQLRAPDTVLATGGFANDRTDSSLLARHRPDLLRFPTTNGEWATGDGMKLAMSAGAATVDMDRVQIHPTGFLDPADTGASTKVLCGEMMRGVGGVLLTPSGSRFVNELAPRDKVVEAQLANGAAEFAIVLNSRAATEAAKHAELYERKGLLSRVQGAAGLAAYMAGMSGAPSAADIEPTVRAELLAYNTAAAAGEDALGKLHFHNAPLEPEDTYLVGRVVPVLHYCMGGIRMDASGAVLRDDNSTIAGLHAAGEVTGGVHGNNRLGGNSLLECTVFGSIVGDKLAEVSAQRRAHLAASASAATLGAGGSTEAVPAPTAVAAPGAAAAAATARVGQPRTVSREELAAHAGAESAWVALYGRVYDLTAFADEHPAGPESIINLAGKDGTAAFEDVHNEQMLSEFESDLVGVLAD